MCKDLGHNGLSPRQSYTPVSKRAGSRSRDWGSGHDPRITRLVISFQHRTGFSKLQPVWGP
ncbi:hypothetical protein FEI15_04545 [Lacticaseibacillus zeae]|uniref:Uncharacterized protein n=1 Tax=Lacticaseibacillus zeae TaxID=57037 RepID=A0A5R8LTH2_LACZE|nr:hypothetical protein FEI15_04545 [Lacticaseibacillus zeae]